MNPARTIEGILGAIAFLFGGPGIAEPGMGRDLYNKNPLVRESMDKADKLLTELGGVRPTKACFASDAEVMRRPSVAGPAVAALAHGVVRALKARKVAPMYAAGFGWGELVALAALGNIDFETALKLLHERGLAVEAAFAAAPWHALAVQGLEYAALQAKLAALPQPPERAALLSDDHFVLTGDEALLKKLHGLLSQAGRGVKVTPVEPGWHWPHPNAQAAHEATAQALAALDFESSSVGFQTAHDADMLRRGQDWPAYLKQHSNRSLDWSAAVRRLRAQGMDTAVEIGHGSALGTALHKADTGVRVLSTDNMGAFALAAKLAN